MEGSPTILAYKRLSMPRKPQYEGELPLRSPKARARVTQRNIPLSLPVKSPLKVNRIKTSLSHFGPDDLYQLFYRDLKGSHKFKLDFLRENWKNFKFRNFIEKGWGARKQCEKVLEEARNDKAICWLCGFSIRELGDELLRRNQPAWTTSKQDADADNAPECEHLLPVSAAIIFHDVALKDLDVVGVKDYYALNYKWAHNICNGLKNHQLFMNIKNDEGLLPHDKITINPDFIRQFITTLLYRSGEISQLSTSKGDWVNQRVASIATSLKPLEEELKNSHFNMLLGVSKVIENIDFLYDNYKKYLEKIGETDTVNALTLAEFQYKGGKRKRNNRTRRRKRNV
jgi:hypothetical protein